MPVTHGQLCKEEIIVVPLHLVPEKIELLQQVLYRHLAVAGLVHSFEGAPEAFELLWCAAQAGTSA
jgi:hypothetical protein